MMSASRLSLDFISGMGMPPRQFVAMADALGVRQVSFGPSPITDNPHGFPAWNLLPDRQLRRDLLSALADHEVSVALGEGFLIMPGMEIAAAQPLVELMAELGAPVLNAVVIEQDRSRALDQFASLAVMAATHGCRVTLEFMPLMWPANPNEAMQFVTDCGADNAGLLLDAMHVYRSGATAEDVRSLDQSRIFYAQVCDVPMPATNSDYGQEARNDRLPPGEGDLPLSQFIAALPAGIGIGLELPMLARARAGIAPMDALRPAIATMRQLLAAST